MFVNNNDDDVQKSYYLQHGNVRVWQSRLCVPGLKAQNTGESSKHCAALDIVSSSVFNGLISRAKLINHGLLAPEPSAFL